MAANKSLLILPGDGIGPEVMGQVRRVVDWFDHRRSVTFEITEGLVGGAAYDAHGTPITDETMSDAMAADAVLFGAVGGPQYDDAPRDLRPEMGLLHLRKEFSLYANVRPGLLYPQLTEASPLKDNRIPNGIDIVCIRELTGGIYFGQPKTTTTLENGEEQAIDTMVYKTSEIERIAQVAIDTAKARGNRVCSVDKANVLETSVLWRKVVTAYFAKHAPEIELSHMYVDNAAMQLARDPNQFDVLFTENMFGDILSDEMGVICGSLGMLPSATLGAVDDSGRRRALYEPVHGSAPDIAGKDMANPIACLLSFAMLLKYSFGMDEDAQIIEAAVQNVLSTGVRTADIMSKGAAQVSTSVMGDAIIREMDKQAA